MTASEMIVRYRKEMMELARNMPDDAFELSLRDIVDLPREKKQVQNADVHEEKEKQQQHQRKKGKKKKRETHPHPPSPIMLNMFISISSSKIKSGGKQSSKPVDKRKITGCLPLISFITNWWSRRDRIGTKIRPSHKLH